MGEAKRRTQTALSAITQAVGVDVPNGRLQVRWDGQSAATPFGQMAFFLEFLHLTGLYERWQTGCPLRYSGPHASRPEDILGTWLLSLLAGQRRFDPRCREARRDLSDPYQLHSTLCRAFCEPDRKCLEGEFLWRLEPETDPTGCPRILVQSRAIPVWTRIGVQGWLAKTDPAIDLKNRLKLDSLTIGQCFRFRLRANPCVKRDDKRLGLLRLEEQEKWVVRKGEQHGFSLPQLASFDLSESLQGGVDVRVSQEQMLGGKQHTGNSIRVFSVLYDGVLAVTEPDKFMGALQTGIGHGKVLGLMLVRRP